jgi:hypothetical protein
LLCGRTYVESSGWRDPDGFLRIHCTCILSPAMRPRRRPARKAAQEPKRRAQERRPHVQYCCRPAAPRKRNILFSRCLRRPNFRGSAFETSASPLSSFRDRRLRGSQPSLCVDGNDRWADGAATDAAALGFSVIQSYLYCIGLPRYSHTVTQNLKSYLKIIFFFPIYRSTTVRCLQLMVFIFSGIVCSSCHLQANMSHK